MTESLPIKAYSVISLTLLAITVFWCQFFEVSSAQALPLAIHDIQGAGSTSPQVGKLVSTTGIVTATKSNGFFLQAPDNQADNDPNTSEGVFVFTSSAPTVALQQTVSVTGTVVEFRPTSEPYGLTLTEITSPTVSVLSQSAVALPAAFPLTVNNVNPNGAFDQLEKFEGMRVSIESLFVVAPTDGTVNEAAATSTSSGVFFGVVTGPRPFREPGLETFDPLPANAPCCIPRFDGNPEVIRVDTRSSTGTPASILNVASGDTVSKLIGPMDFSSGRYSLMQTTPNTIGAAPTVNQLNPSAQPVRTPEATEFTIASFNMERFFDTVNDPNASDVVLTQAAFDLRLNKASLAIRNVMRSPDIIGVEEVENLTTLQAIAAKLNADAGNPNPNYQAFLVEGNDPGGIDVGFLIKGSRVTATSVTQIGKDATYIDPTNGQPASLNDRPPLLLLANIQAPSGSQFAVTVIVNHLRSLLSLNDPTTGPRVRAKRRAQAEFLANLIQTRQSANASERIVALGDFNAFQINDGYVDVMGTIKGAPAAANQVASASADLVNPDLINLLDVMPTDSRYSYVFDGNAQTIDHVLITANLLPLSTGFEYARNNADFPESLRGVATRPERISDHDMPVAFFAFEPPPTPLTLTSVSAASYRGVMTARDMILAAFGTNLATSIQVANSIPLPTTLGGVSLIAKDRLGIETPVPLFFVSPSQINYLMPPGVLPGKVTITASRSDTVKVNSVLTLDAVAPGLFTANSNGSGVAAATVLRIRADGSQSYEPVARFDQATNQFVSVPIDFGAESDLLFLIIFGTGIRHRSSMSLMTAQIGGVNAEVLYADAQGDFVGLDQINLRLPKTLIGRGEVDLTLTVEGKQANTVKVRFK
ncbi:MAG: endonuclease/exonuclease/phosphatase family protein [Blastocatellia bacterium]